MAVPSRLSKGFSFVMKNPQLLYTLFLLVAITAAFLLSAQKFLDLSQSFQERLEKDRVGLMQDVFVEFASVHINDEDFMQERVVRISGLDTTITEFKVLKKEGVDYTVIASLDENEIGSLADDTESLIQYQQATTDSTYMFQTYIEGERHWAAVRGILDESHNVLGVVFTNISADHIDKLLANKRLEATYFLVFIIIIIMFLLMRQAKVVDYAVLYRRLKEVDQMKDDFIGMAAHELRTPLTIIRGYAEMLSSSNQLTEEDKQLSKNIMASSGQLNLLVSDILDVSRIQQGRLAFDIRSIDAALVVAEIMEDMSITAKQKGLMLIHEKIIGRTVHADSDRLKQVLINIIGNAIKYTESGSITVTTGVAKEVVTIRVSDTGYGISAEDQKSLFHRFYRVHSKETEDIRGTGLGLWISREIITQMKGDITVESIKGKGTDFIITLPFAGSKKS